MPFQVDAQGKSAISVIHLDKRLLRSLGEEPRSKLAGVTKWIKKWPLWNKMIPIDLKSESWKQVLMKALRNVERWLSNWARCKVWMSITKIGWNSYKRKKLKSKRSVDKLKKRIRAWPRELNNLREQIRHLLLEISYLKQTNLRFKKKLSLKWQKSWTLTSLEGNWQWLKMKYLKAMNQR